MNIVGRVRTTLKDLFTVTSRAYRETFATDPARITLADLARFCHMYDTTHVEGDPTSSATLEGRRQVFLRIVGKARLREAEVYRMVEELQDYEASA